MTVGGLAGLVASLSNTITLGIMAGLVVGKLLGITGTVALLTRSPRFRLDPTIALPDLIGMSFVAGSASPLPCLSATCPTQRPRLTRTSGWASSPDR